MIKNGLIEKQIVWLRSIHQIKKGDVIFQPLKDQHYLVNAISGDYLLVSDANEIRALRILYFSELSKGKWQINPAPFPRNDVS
jgi:hypothetical protein